DLGWQRGYRWGREARLPDDFDYALTGRDQRRPLADWVTMGVTDAYGRALPPLEVPTAVIVPSGGEGPAFLAYPNFDIIMRWNRSEFYALAVGRLADRIAGAGELTRAPADAELKLTFEDVRALQTSLNSLGYLNDEPDGLFGPNTRRALSAFQRDRDLRADGFPSEEALRVVRTASEAP
ncbi:MAG: lytic murein transglycosylase, partial [Woeseia sp.]|nr:lytic murein transglycosylase [Woeseia sp.]